jgi:hypothetical protein
MSVIVRLMSGGAMKVNGDRWTEPPVQPHPIPGVVYVDHEIEMREADQIRHDVRARASNYQPLVGTPGYTYEPIIESLFVVVYRGDDKVASFNPTEVLAVYAEDDVEPVEE